MRTAELHIGERKLTVELEEAEGRAVVCEACKRLSTAMHAIGITGASEHEQTLEVTPLLLGEIVRTLRLRSEFTGIHICEHGCWLTSASH
jgi:hypothetical protein